jgi:hypothetical protein
MLSLSPRGAALALAFAGLGLAAGCGGDDDGDGGAQPRTLEITATGSGRQARFELPKSTEGGLTEVRLTNSGKDEQEAQLIRVEGDHSVREVLEVIQGEGGRIPSWLRAQGGVGTTQPGKTGSSVDLLPEGRYYVIGTGEEGPPATASLTVEGGDTGGELPDTSALVVARDYSFEASGLKAGENRVRFENEGREPHHVVAFPLRPGAQIGAVARFFRTEKGEPPIEDPDASAVIDGGGSQLTDLELRKGRYALVCFVTDRKGGPPHTAKGMISEATVR